MDSRSPVQGLTRQKPRRQPGLQFSSEAQEPILSSLVPGRIYFLMLSWLSLPCSCWLLAREPADDLPENPNTFLPCEQGLFSRPAEAVPLTF